MSTFIIIVISFLIGFIVGYIVKDLLPADIQYKGKFKQKGTNNVMTIDKPKKVKEKRFKRKKRQP